MVLPLYTQCMEKSPSRWWDLPSAALFVVAILTSVWRLTVTDWTDNLGYVINLATAAAIVGLALGASRFGKRAVSWLALAYTLVLIPRQLVAFYDSKIYLGEKLAGVGGRLLFSIGEFAANKPVKDPIFFIFLIGTAYWCIALISGYQLARYNNTLAALLPAGLTMLVIHQFDRGNSDRVWIVAIFLFIALTLIGRGKYLRDHIGWVQRGVHLAPETGPDLSMGVLVGAAALILLAWNLPLNLNSTPALEKKWQDFSRPWRATRDRLSRAFDALEGQGAAERVENFRSSMSLGSNAAQGSTLMFKVSAPPDSLELPRLYWRARVYDHYENGNWSESPTVTDEFSPDTNTLAIPDIVGRREFEFAITSFTQGQAILNLPTQPVWISRPVDVISFPLEDGTQDVLVLQTFPFLEPGETYHVRAAMANPSVLELRSAGEDYPDWVKTRYLQLPANFSPRVQTFARQVTFGLTTPYEKAQAITTVLRSQIKYEPNLILPPRGTDLIEWFLFDGKQGYCNYYATAEVLMLRSLGIPARMAMGFAQGDATAGIKRPGETEPTTQEFTIYRKHMHAWPEVYFPGIGWVEYEPTANQDPLIRPATPLSAQQPAPVPDESQNPDELPVKPKPEETDNQTGQSSQRSLWQRGLLTLLWSAAIFLVAFAFHLMNQRYGLATRAAEYVLSATERRGERGLVWVRNVALYVLANPFERAFHPVNVSLRWMGESPAVHLTPAERAKALKAIMPEAEEEIETLLREYQSAQYSPRGGDIHIARHTSRRLLWLGLKAAIRRADSNVRW
jgi:transglutaminase-like putative cysteine protease